jgi:tricorn protease-like protein
MSLGQMPLWSPVLSSAGHFHAERTFMLPPSPRTTFLAVVCVLFLVSPAAAQTKLLRFPDIHGDRVAFTYAGDLWTASTSGGMATRLTAHPGIELYAKFSPDGKWIAFTGQYDGDAADLYNLRH